MTDRELLEKILEEIGDIKTRTGNLEDGMEKLGTEVQGIKAEIKEMKKDVLEVKVVQEVKVLPGLSLLAEGHENIVEHIQEKIDARADKLQDSIDVLSIAVKYHSEDIQELKKAQ